MKIQKIYLFRKYLLFFVFCINHNAVYSQDLMWRHLSRVFAPIPPPIESILQNCITPSLNGCSYVRNNPFEPNLSYDPNVFSHTINPFNFNGSNTLITDWEVATGTPTVWNNGGFFSNYPLPPNGLNYFFGATSFNTVSNKLMCESVVQKIPTLSIAKTYVLSFQKMYKSWLELPPPDNTDFPVYSFRIVLMRCQDYNQTFLTQSQISYDVPNLPAISQTIYCEMNVNNPNWKQVFLKFTTNYNYDLMWIIPSGEPDLNTTSGLLVTQPELIDVTNFSAGNNPTPTPPNCNVTIGPATPNCGPTGAVFTWTGPQGQTPNVPANQQITFNASIPANAGTWTLKMTMPNAFVTNSACGIQQPVISASVNVPSCIGACTTPTITPLGPTIQCVWYEAGPWLTLTTNLTSNIQWYDDGVPIYQGNTQTITLTNNPGSANTWPTFTGHITVKNTLYANCISQPLTVTRKNYSTPWAYPGSNNTPRTPSQYCKNQTGIVRQVTSISDPNTIFWWEVLDPNNNPATGVNINPMYTTNSTANISFANYTYSSATIIAKSSDNGCSNLWNYSYPVTINQSCLSEPNLNLYPNPASSQIVISTSNNALIQFVEIGNLVTPSLKKIKVNGTKYLTINIYDLIPGIYNCKITTNLGVENQKLIIKR